MTDLNIEIDLLTFGGQNVKRLYSRRNTSIVSCRNCVLAFLTTCKTRQRSTFFRSHGIQTSLKSFSLCLVTILPFKNLTNCSMESTVVISIICSSNSSHLNISSSSSSHSSFFGLLWTRISFNFSTNISPYTKYAIILFFYLENILTSITAPLMVPSALSAIALVL